VRWTTKASAAWHQLETLGHPGAGIVEDITQDDIAEAAAVLFESLTPALSALEMVKKEALERGLPEDVADELVRGLTRKIVEAM
jgi:hypothetical protein